MKKTVAVFFGGHSTEHDVSIITALSSVIKPLELTGKYTVIPVYITKSGMWLSDEKLKDIALYRTKKIDEFIAKSKPVSIVFDGGMLLRKAGFGAKDQRIDIAFPAMHGLYGEDGSLMGLLRMAGVPFVGSDMEASVIAMDKVLAKQVAEANHIPVSKYEYLYGKTFDEKPDEIIAKFGRSFTYPLFVKPAHLGSSIGITRVATGTELKNAIELAAHYDNKVIIEEAVQNLIEVTVPIIGNEVVEVALVERPLANGEEFFDFDTKYMHGGKKKGGTKQAGSQGYSELPAKLSDKMYKEAVIVAKSAYKATECEGIARIDLLIDSKTGIVYFNEINPLPGSLYAHNWRAAGISSTELVIKLVEYAEERYLAHRKFETVFSSSFLQQF